MYKWASRERAILNIAAVCLVFFTLDRVLVAPLWQRWDSLNSAIEKKRLIIADDQRLLGESEKIKHDYAESFLPRSRREDTQRGGEMTSLLREIEMLAGQSGVKIHDIKPQTNSSRSQGTRSVFVSTDSSWTALAQFIYLVQRSPQLLRLQKGSLHREGESENHLTGQFVISETSQLGS